MGAEAPHIVPMLEAMARAGLKTVELSSNLCHAGPDRDPAFIAALREALQPFTTVTVHGGTTAIDAHDQEPLDLERLDVYVRLMDFGQAVGARYATFHPLMPHKYDLMLTPHFEDEATVAQHVEAGRCLIDLAHRHHQVIGFEVFDHRIAEGLSDDGWGILFDIGHASQNGARPPFGDVTEQAVAMIDSRFHRVVQFHLHGVARVDGTLKAHQPLDDENLIDYARIIRMLDERQFGGPLLFEIIRKGGRTLPFEEALAATVAAREGLRRALN